METPTAMEALILRQQKRADAERAAGAKMFMGRPDRWYDSPKWRCLKGHVLPPLPEV